VKNILLNLLFFLFCFTALIAQTSKGKIIDIKTSLPIPNVAIQANQKTGTFSDVNGFFTIELKSAKQVVFSCLGYQTKTITIDSLKLNNYIVKLVEADNNLDEVVLSNQKISFDSIMQSVRFHLKTNYTNAPKKRTVFLRFKNQPDFKKVEFELNRSTLLSRKKRKLANKDFEAFSKKLKNVKTSFYTDYYGNYYSSFFKSKKNRSYLISKSDSLQGFKTLNNDENFTLDAVQDKAQILFLSQLNKQHTYKLKSGLFKLEDSVSIGKLSDELNASKDSLDVSNFRRNISYILREFKFSNKKKSTNFLDAYYYKYKLLDTISTTSSTQYIVSFSPRKSKAKFSGKLFIDADDFAVTKVQYQYAKGKRGKHLNLRLLMGVKFSENYKKGTLIFERDQTGFYQLKYAKEKEGRYFYINRSLKFIENSKAREKIKFGLKIEGNFFTTTEMVTVKTSLINKEDFKKISKIKGELVMTKQVYNTTSWKNGKLLQQFKN
jgi:hypothetical protein